VGNFSSFVTGNMQQSISEFRRTLDQLALNIFGLFIARWGLGSISKVIMFRKIYRLAV
jgi:hypothetical protein